MEPTASAAKPEPPPPDDQPASAPKADLTLQQLSVSSEAQATRIVLTTSAPSGAIRLSEISAQDAYVVDFPGNWAIAPEVNRTLRPSDARVLRVEVKQTDKYLRLTLYCVPDVINQPLVVASGEGFAITVR